jgi:hypothetical protein
VPAQGVHRWLRMTGLLPLQRSCFLQALLSEAYPFSAEKNSGRACPLVIHATTCLHRQQFPQQFPSPLIARLRR